MGSELEIGDQMQPEDLLGDGEDTGQVLDQAINQLRGTLEEGKSPPGQPDAAPAAAVEAGHINQNLVMSIPVNVQVVLGSVEIALSELMNLKQGSTIGLDRKLGEPIDIVANNQRIARGEITVIEGETPRFGVKLTEVVGT